MDELVEYLMDDPQDEAGRPKVVKMPGNITPNSSSRYSHASEADSYRGKPFAANADAKSGKEMAFTTKAADRTAAQVGAAHMRSHANLYGTPTHRSLLFVMCVRSCLHLFPFME